MSVTPTHPTRAVKPYAPQRPKVFGVPQSINVVPRVLFPLDLNTHNDENTPDENDEENDENNENAEIMLVRVFKPARLAPPLISSSPPTQ